MESLPSLSVIVPVYNRAALVGATLESVLAQPYRGEREVIVVDDGSTDDLPAALERFGGAIRVLRQENAGVAAARNRGIEEARGEYIALCDSDDLWTPDHLEAQMRVFADYPNAGFVYGDAVLFEDTPAGERRTWRISEPRPSGFILGDLLQKSFIVPSTALFPRSVFREFGGFDPETTRTEDYDLFLRIAARREVVFCGRACCLYRRHAAALTRQPRPYWRAFLVTLTKARHRLRLQHLKGELRDPVEGGLVSERVWRAWDALLRRRIASFHLRLARLAGKEGRLGEAWAEARAALRLRPHEPELWAMIWRLCRYQIRPRSRG